MSARPLLELHALTGGYGDVTVVRDVTLVVPAGEAICVTGRNGVGKSTLVKLIAGQLPVVSGTIRFDGKDITELPDHSRHTLGIGYAPQESVVFDTLSILENLTLHYRDRDLVRYRDLFATFPRIEERLTQLAGTLSGGEKKMLSFCRTLAEETQLVILDEPSEGVQPENIERMAETVVKARTNGRSFLIIEQNLSLVEAVANHVYLLDHGECVFDTDNGERMRQTISDRLNL